MYPTLNEEQKALAINSLLKDMLKLTQDPTLDVSLTVPSAFPNFQPVIPSPVESEQPPIQLIEKSASLLPKETE